jgi:Phytanoyl-CoA dioxygenase (PhyH)
MSDSFEAQGFAVIPDVLTEPECQRILGVVLEQRQSQARLRACLTHDWCQKLAISLKQHVALAGIVAPTAVAVQCTLFEKSPDNNWLVCLHQDLSIPVRERVDDSELSGWSTKEGGLFVQPPASVLESLVALRVHLDDCGSERGALRVVPGSHRFGRLDGRQATALRDEYGEVTPVVKQGGVLAMRPLPCMPPPRQWCPRFAGCCIFCSGRRRRRAGCDGPRWWLEGTNLGHCCHCHQGGWSIDCRPSIIARLAQR